jgi:hypothetical protein
VLARIISADVRDAILPDEIEHAARGAVFFNLGLIDK